MNKFIKLLIITTACIFLAACAANRNEYGVPKNQWEKISKNDQDLIKNSNQPMTFSEDA